MYIAHAAIRQNVLDHFTLYYFFMLNKLKTEADYKQTKTMNLVVCRRCQEAAAVGRRLAHHRNIQIKIHLQGDTQIRNQMYGMNYAHFAKH